MDEYQDLIHWLDMADQILQIVDEPVRDQETEFSVSFIAVSSFIFKSECLICQITSLTLILRSCFDLNCCHILHFAALSAVCRRRSSTPKGV